MCIDVLENGVWTKVCIVQGEGGWLLDAKGNRYHYCASCTESGHGPDGVFHRFDG